MPRFAANLSFLFTERPFRERFAAASAAGFRAVEILFPYDHAAETVAGQLAASKLELALFNLPPGDWAAGERGLAALPSRAAEFRASVDRALGYAQATRTTRLHALAGLAAPGDKAAVSAYRDALAYACERAGPLGVDVLIEPINGRDMPGYFLDSFERAAELIEAMRLPNLRLQFDIYHRQILRGDVIRGLEALMPLIGHVQVASVPDRREPGSGELDDAAAFAALDRLGYQGFVGCEYHPSGRSEDGLGWFAPYRAEQIADSR
ncbi:2-oxo-tetronate isomerase [Hansschlegelia zhihuaiae]|uniref:Hydroxypyruvate isomerase n=1 Tax=Hansschlegelia zhihuaiae TaxID=405005 RepID=A0A4Q0MND4_9HYPH|nr:2-oxo-tetronate isomerase [Hansschlegelia zhihuaiae]RXF74589.1 hydroxypyruvate isomerase [Hansschlegelia zhihuaiae]